MLLWAVCFARKELRPKEAKRSLRRVRSTDAVGASLVGAQEEYRVQITEYSPVGASLVGAQKNNREQRAGTRPAPTVHKYREAVILSKAKNLIKLRTGNCSPV